MRCAAFVIIFGALSTLNAGVTVSGQAVDGSEIFTETTEVTSERNDDFATVREVPLPGLLFPQESESREESHDATYQEVQELREFIPRIMVKSLDGLWDFAVSPSDDALKGYLESWYSEDLSKSAKVMQMPVPSSYNDVTTSKALRDHVGAVWYQKNFFIPLSWADQRVFVRFGSVNYLAEVWVNGELVTSHEMGHLPFEAEITGQLKYGSKNRITVAVDNSLLATSVPQGKIITTQKDNGTENVQTYTFDFFNYAGIHRPVLLQTKPRVFIEDITVKTSIIGTTGIVKYSVQAAGLQEDEVADCTVVLRKDDDTLAIDEETTGLAGTIKVPEAKLWWPIGMNPEPAYLYTLEVTLSVRNATKPDVYRLPVGIRSLRWTNTSVLFNEKPVYLRGFGRHEDSVIRGRGLDLVTMTRDYELLKWVGANSYRTSHYPYSDEILDMADRQGILIINECPAVDIENYSSQLLARHKASISELIRRDKNRPSVLMWSIANEPRTQLYGTEDYYRKLTLHTKTLDPTRPITAALNRGYLEDKAGQFLDVIGFNRYNSWYSDSGRLGVITNKVVDEAVNWNEKHNKPVMMLEYGADTMPGLHELPSYVWSEEYQKEAFARHFVAFDRLRLKGFFIGEFIWNFADFRTAQTYTRVGGNKKGIFTRTREPKMVAHHVRKRYHSLSEELDGVKAPRDLEAYITGHGYDNHEEL